MVVMNLIGLNIINNNNIYSGRQENYVITIGVKISIEYINKSI